MTAWLIRLTVASLVSLWASCAEHGRPIDEAGCLERGGIYSDAACRAGGPADCDVCILPWRAR